MQRALAVCDGSGVTKLQDWQNDAIWISKRNASKQNEDNWVQNVKEPIPCVHVHVAFLLSILQWCGQVPHVGWLIAHIGQADISSSPVTALQVLQSTDEAQATIHFAKPYHQITCLLYISERNEIILYCT